MGKSVGERGEVAEKSVCVCMPVLYNENATADENKLPRTSFSYFIVRSPYIIHKKDD